MNEERLRNFLDLRTHLELRSNEGGRLELGFDLGILAVADTSGGGKERLLSLPGVEGVSFSLLKRRVEIRYDPDRLDPGFWVAMLQGSEEEARAALEALPPGEGEA